MVLRIFSLAFKFVTQHNPKSFNIDSRLNLLPSRKRYAYEVLILPIAIGGSCSALQEKNVWYTYIYRAQSILAIATLKFQTGSWTMYPMWYDITRFHRRGQNANNAKQSCNRINSKTFSARYGYKGQLEEDHLIGIKSVEIF